MIRICKLEAGSLNPSVSIAENIAAKSCFSIGFWLVDRIIEQILVEFITFFKYPGLPADRTGSGSARITNPLFTCCNIKARKPITSCDSRINEELIVKILTV